MERSKSKPVTTDHQRTEPQGPCSHHPCHLNPPPRRVHSFMTLHRLRSDGQVVGRDEPRHRDPSRSWRSSARWQRMRAEQVARSPRCAKCGHTGSNANPLTADHILPASTHPSLRYTWTNLQTLCALCNAAKGARGAA